MPETIEGLKYMKDLYEKGYIYKDFYSSKGYDAKARFLSGMVGIYADCPNLGQMCIRDRYNVKRSLGIECSREEVEVGISEVKNTIKHIVYYHDAKSNIINSLENVSRNF